MGETLDSLRATATKANEALTRAEANLAAARDEVTRAASAYRRTVIAWANQPPAPPASLVTPGKSGTAPGQAAKAAAAALSPIDDARARLDKAMSDFTAVRRSLGV